MNTTRAKLIAEARGAELARTVGRLAELRAEEFQLAARLQSAALNGGLTAEADAALNGAPPRPNYERFVGGHVLRDIHSSRAGEPAALAVAADFWREVEARALQMSTAQERAA